MGDKIEVDPDLLRSHAGKVERVGEGVKLAQDAANSTNIGGGAFGIMCAFMVPPALVAATAARGTIGSAAGMVDRSAHQLRGLARDFEQNEEAASERLANLEAEL